MKSKPWLFFTLLIVLLSCAKESQLRLELSSNLNSFYPQEVSSMRFFNNNGDTVLLPLTVKNEGFEKVEVELGTGGALSDLEQIEAEGKRVVFQENTQGLELSFDWQAEYSAERPNFSYDRFELRLRDTDPSEEALLSLEYRDSLQCTSPRCQYADTLRLLSKTYRKVYFTRRDSVSQKALYLSQTKGLIGFKAANNQLFERIF